MSRTKLLRVLAVFTQNFTTEVGHFGCFRLIKSYTETALLIDEKYISQEASYTAQQSSRRVKCPKTCIEENTFA